MTAAAAQARLVELRPRLRQLGDGTVRETSDSPVRTPRLVVGSQGTLRANGDGLPAWWYARLVRRLCPGGGRLLELGCGTGALLKRLAASFDACGHDPSALARSQCRTEVPDAVVLEDWTVVPPSSFEIVVCLRGALLGDRPLPALQAVTGKLAPGGVLLLAVPNQSGLGRRLKGRRWFAAAWQRSGRLLSRGEWMMLLRRAGLGVERVMGDGLWDVPYWTWLPVQAQRLVLGLPAALQAFTPGRWFLPTALGECLVFVARKPVVGDGR